MCELSSLASATIAYICSHWPEYCAACLPSPTRTPCGLYSAVRSYISQKPRTDSELPTLVPALMWSLAHSQSVDASTLIYDATILLNCVVATP